MARKWQHVRGSSHSWDGLYMSIDRNDPLTIAVYEVSLWEDMDSSAVAEYGKYNVQCGYVDLSRMGPTLELPMTRSRDPQTGYYNRTCDLAGALSCVGLYMCTADGCVYSDSGDEICKFDSPILPLVLAEACWSYGAKNVEDDSSGNNLRNLIRGARRMLA